jgi:hypothetical protein
LPTTTWQQASAVVDAPPGTATFTVELSHTSGLAGDVVFVDDVVVHDL